MSDNFDRGRFEGLVLAKLEDIDADLHRYLTQQDALIARVTALEVTVGRIGVYVTTGAALIGAAMHFVLRLIFPGPKV